MAPKKWGLRRTGTRSRKAEAVAVARAITGLVGIAGDSKAGECDAVRHRTPPAACAFALCLLRRNDDIDDRIIGRCDVFAVLAPRQRDDQHKNRQNVTDRRHNLPPAVPPGGDPKEAQINQQEFAYG